MKTLPGDPDHRQKAEGMTLTWSCIQKFTLMQNNKLLLIVLLLSFFRSCIGRGNSWLNRQTLRQVSQPLEALDQVLHQSSRLAWEKKLTIPSGLNTNAALYRARYSLQILTAV